MVLGGMFLGLSSSITFSFLRRSSLAALGIGRRFAGLSVVGSPVCGQFTQNDQLDLCAGLQLHSARELLLVKYDGIFSGCLWLRISTRYKDVEWFTGFNTDKPFRTCYAPP